MMTKLVGLSLLLCLCPALPAQQSSDLQSAPATPLGNDTNRATVLELRQQIEQEKQLSRQAISHTKPAPDYSYLETKDIRQMTPQELSRLAIMRPDLYQAHMDPLKTPQQREQERQRRQAIMDPVGWNRQL
jgi:hypothetical protein